MMPFAVGLIIEQVRERVKWRLRAPVAIDF
jgi:hypothetical protein